jgi:FkbM family methyltransferase
MECFLLGGILSRLLSRNDEVGFFERNKLVALAIIIGCMLFIGMFFMEKSKSVKNMIPVFRGEVPLDDGFSITTIRGKYPILIKKDDPLVGSQLRFSGSVRSVFSEVAANLVKKNDVVVEIGSHFGYNTINIAKKLENGKFYAFEPNGKVFSYLKKSIFLNDLSDIVVLRNVGISDSRGNYSIDDCLFVPGKDKGSREILVNMNTLDEELMGELSSVSLLLIDIPGFEFSIISSADRTIACSPNIKIVVFFDKNASSETFKIEKIESELRKLENDGFYLYIAETDKYVKVNVEELLKLEKEVLIITRDRLTCI